MHVLKGHQTRGRRSCQQAELHAVTMWHEGFVISSFAKARLRRQATKMRR